VGKIDSARMRAESRRDRPYFIVLGGSEVGQMFLIERSETILGRGAGANIRIRDDGVSRLHARVFLNGKDVSIEDMESANGTLVNGERVDRHELREGDKVQIGATTILKFTYADRLEESFQRTMYDAAIRDGLTQAYTKRYLVERIQTEIAYASRHRTQLSLLMLDVDHFKAINDTHGHPGGDYVLASLAQGITRSLRTEDVFARFGGEEFAILCRGVALDGAAVLGERVRALVEAAALVFGGKAISVTISVGVAAYADQPDASTQLVLAADAALYRAKTAGRNRVVTA
jgi:diguanylate cyclase (GGDEF)-like protein